MGAQKYPRTNHEQKKLKFSSLFPAIFGREVIINQSEDQSEESYFYIYQGSLYTYHFFFKINAVTLEKDDQKVDEAYYDQNGLDFYKKHVMLRATTRALVDQSPTLARIFDPDGKLVREEDIIGLIFFCDVMDITPRRIKLNLYALKRTDFYDIYVSEDGKYYDIIKNGKVVVWERQEITPEKDIFALVRRFSVDRARALADAVTAWGNAWYWNASEGNGSMLLLGRNRDESVRIECFDTNRNELKIVFDQHPTFFMGDEKAFGSVVGKLEDASLNPEDL